MKKKRLPSTQHLWITGIILVLAQAVGAQWSDPILVDSNQDTLGINTDLKEWCPFISVDGQYFYFARDNTPNDLYVSHRVGDAWSRPLRLPFCDPDVDERNPAVNPTNDTLYFIAWAPGWDIFWCFRTGPSDTSWSTPVPMQSPINSDGIEFSVWTTPDNQRLIFSSWRIGANGEDIYECRRQSGTQTGWSDPILLPGMLNTGDVESYPSMSFDTTELFFWGRGEQICTSHLGDSGWSFGTPLPPNINRVIFQDPTEKTPCITADGLRLYFASRWGDSVSTAGDIWYSERPSRIDQRHERIADGYDGFETMLYPNPCNGWPRLSLAPEWYEHGAMTVTVYNTLGQVIWTRSGLRTASAISPEVEAASGIYVVRVTNGQRTQQAKFVVLK